LKIVFVSLGEGGILNDKIVSGGHGILQRKGRANPSKLRSPRGTVFEPPDQMFCLWCYSWARRKLYGQGNLLRLSEIYGIA
jgi:hypothetical protein